ncbi:putative entry exclusion protein TrbK-alt [Bradyrhizobium sp. USDA 4369]
MKSYLTPRQFARAAATALVVLAIAVAVLRSRRGGDAAGLMPTETGKADVLERGLARCRTILPDDFGLLEFCRHIWADNRLHFFRSTKSPSSPAAPAPYVPLGPGAARYGVPSLDVGQPRVR